MCNTQQVPGGGGWKEGQLCLVIDWHGVRGREESKTAPLGSLEEQWPRSQEVGAAGRKTNCHLK